MPRYKHILPTLLMLLLSISPASAIQISLSEGKIEQYLQVLELYVLPFLVVATIVLFCGYVVSRIFHRTQMRRVEREMTEPSTSPDDETAAFLRELNSVPPIEDPDPDPKKEQRSRFQRAFGRRSKSENLENADEKPIDSPATPPRPGALEAGLSKEASDGQLAGTPTLPGKMEPDKPETDKPEAPWHGSSSPQVKSEHDQPLLLEEASLIEEGGSSPALNRPASPDRHSVQDVHAQTSSDTKSDNSKADDGERRKQTANSHSGDREDERPSPIDRDPTAMTTRNLAEKRAEDILRSLVGRNPTKPIDANTEVVEPETRSVTVSPSEPSRSDPGTSERMRAESSPTAPAPPKLADSPPPKPVPWHAPPSASEDLRSDVRPDAPASQVAKDLPVTTERPPPATARPFTTEAPAAKDWAERKSTEPQNFPRPDAALSPESIAARAFGESSAPAKSGAPEPEARSVLSNASTVLQESAEKRSALSDTDIGERRRPDNERPARRPDPEPGHHSGPQSVVVQPLNPMADPTSAALKAARTAAKSIFDDIEQATLKLQTCLESVDEHDKAKDGLQLDDVRSMKITGIEWPSNISGRLEAFGDGVADEVRDALSVVSDHNHLVGRLEVVADEQPLDEGWNDLIRPRLVQALSVLRRVKKEISSHMSATDVAPGLDGSSERDMPFGRSKG